MDDLFLGGGGSHHVAASFCSLPPHAKHLPSNSGNLLSVNNNYGCNFPRLNTKVCSSLGYLLPCPHALYSHLCPGGHLEWGIVWVGQENDGECLGEAQKLQWAASSHGQNQGQGRDWGQGQAGGHNQS